VSLIERIRERENVNQSGEQR
jgi:hypothetical protein